MIKINSRLTIILIIFSVCSACRDGAIKSNTNLPLKYGSMQFIHDNEVNIASSMVKNQHSRIKDKYGQGAYGASRDKGTRMHNGIDIITQPNEKIFAPFDCQVLRETIPYKDDKFYKGILFVGKNGWQGYEVKVFYVEGLISGDVTAGQEIGICQDLNLKYPEITNHIHVEVKKDGVQIDPFELWQMSF